MVRIDSPVLEGEAHKFSNHKGDQSSLLNFTREFIVARKQYLTLSREKFSWVNWNKNGAAPACWLTFAMSDYWLSIVFQKSHSGLMPISEKRNFMSRLI